MVGQIRKVRDLARPDAGWWRKQWEWQARQRLVDLAKVLDLQPDWGAHRGVIRLRIRPCGGV
ncbi:hypothetical protein ACFVYE_15160 [Streptomyces sp. NPDC058239]|uniref:hypothetical protein n=1 Tax=unclassified Streptomyces TaxID=2593676 RepID=UPI003667C317